MAAWVALALFVAGCGVWARQALDVGPQYAGAGFGNKSGFALVDPDEGKPAPRDAAGRRVRAPRRFDTFAHRALDVEAEADFVSADKYALLDAIVEDCRRRVTYDRAVTDPECARLQATDVLLAIDAALLEHGVLYPPGEYDVPSLRLGTSPQRFDDATLAKVLKVDENARRRGRALKHAREPFYVMDCDIGSIVYVGVAEALGVELKLVDLPDHMFVRWDLPDGTHINWDTNDARHVEDAELIADYHLGRDLLRRRVYMAGMTPREADGYILSLRAERWDDKERPAEAIADLKRAAELYPQSTGIRNDLAWLYATAAGLRAEDRAAAVRMAQEVVAVEADRGDFWDTLATAYAVNGDFASAVRCGEKAVRYADKPEDRATFTRRREGFRQGKVLVD